MCLWNSYNFGSKSCFHPSLALWFYFPISKAGMLEGVNGAGFVMTLRHPGQPERGSRYGSPCYDEE